jgi:hypothetical protein
VATVPHPFTHRRSSTLGLAQPLSLLLALCAFSLHAQATGTDWPSALSAANPATPVPAPPPTRWDAGASTAPEAAAPTDLQQARTLWQRANDRVAQFPRGHMDVLRWEAQHTPNADSEPGTTTANPLDLGQVLQRSLRHRTDLFTQPDMNAVARGEVQRAYIAHVRQVQGAWINAISAAQSLRLMADVLDAARTGAELGQRMVQIGHWSQAKLMREQLVQAQAWQDWAQAVQADLAAREHLAGLMGEWRAQAISELSGLLPSQLPALPEQLTPGQGVDGAVNVADIEAAVLRSHPTLDWQRQDTQRQLGAVAPGLLADWQRAVAGTVSAVSSSPYTAPEITARPLLRDATLARAVQAESNLLQLAAERRAMARQAWANLQAQHALARHAQDTIGRLRIGLEQETTQRYNGMLQSTWELLASARDRMQALDAAVQARRDFWLAQADWQALLAGGDYADTAPAASTGRATSPTSQGH